MKKLARIIIIVFLPIYFLLTSVEFSAYNIDFYTKNFEENSVSEATGMKENELKSISKEIIKYIDGSRDSFDILNKSGDSYFNNREITHMEDVIVLFNKGRVLKSISFFLILSSLIYLFVKDKKTIPKTIVKMTIIWVSIFVGITILAFINFNWTFELFHKILFNNDLWLLDPEEDLLINLLTEDFFFKLFLNILIVFIVKLGIVTILSMIVNRRNRNEESSSYNGRA